MGLVDEHTLEQDSADAFSDGVLLFGSDRKGEEVQEERDVEVRVGAGVSQLVGDNAEEIVLAWIISNRNVRRTL